MKRAVAIVERDLKPENVSDDERDVVIRWLPDDDTARLRRVAGILCDILDTHEHSGGR
jgi:orotate phosphoribosyltransferase-like protein